MSAALGDLTTARRMADLEASRAPIPDGVEVDAIDIADRSGLLVTAGEDRRTILHVHGGGYCFGSSATHRDLGIRMAQATGCRVVLLDYRLAPEAPCPAAVDDVDAAISWLFEFGFADVGSLVVSGDSAGGGAVLAAVLRRVAAGGGVPGALVLQSPWVDLTGPVVPPPDEEGLGAALDAMAGAYASVVGRDDPLASPLRTPTATLALLPPTLLQVGTDEVFLDEAQRFHDLAVDAGAPVEIEVWDGCPHVWHAEAEHPQAGPAIARIASFVDRHTADAT